MHLEVTSACSVTNAVFHVQVSLHRNTTRPTCELQSAHHRIEYSRKSSLNSTYPCTLLMQLSSPRRRSITGTYASSLRGGRALACMPSFFFFFFLMLRHLMIAGRCTRDLRRPAAGIRLRGGRQKVSTTPTRAFVHAVLISRITSSAWKGRVSCRPTL